MKKYVAIGTACAALAMAGCDGGKTVLREKSPATPDSISLEDLNSLSGKRIFFGHQSVGRNVIDGLKDIAREKGWAGFNFVEARTPGDAPGFYHAAIGKNGDPLGKIKDFETIMRGGMGNEVDIALMKLCYVDIGAGVDANVVYEAYTKAMDGLELAYPKTVFIRVTAPLLAAEKGLKPLAKRLLGIPLSSLEGNVAREQLNSLIRSDCLNRGKPLFDIALSESTSTSGSRISLRHRGEQYFQLREEYTYDGGHLTEAGRKVAAMALLAAAIQEIH